jgi:hypothetical protein
MVQLLHLHSKRRRLTKRRRFSILNLTLASKHKPIFLDPIQSLSVKRKRSKNVEALSHASFIFQVLIQFSFSYHYFYFFFCSNFSFVCIKLITIVKRNRNHLLEILSSTKLEVRDFSSTAANNYSAKGFHFYQFYFLFLL